MNQTVQDKLISACQLLVPSAGLSDWTSCKVSLRLLSSGRTQVCLGTCLWETSDSGTGGHGSTQADLNTLKSTLLITSWLQRKHTRSKEDSWKERRRSLIQTRKILIYRKAAWRLLGWGSGFHLESLVGFGERGIINHRIKEAERGPARFLEDEEEEWAVGGCGQSVSRGRVELIHVNSRV